MISFDMDSSKMSVFNYFCYFSILIFSVCAAEYVPTLIWQSSKLSESKIPFPSLEKIKTDTFYDYVKKIVGRKEKPLVVLFTEESLSVEDFSWLDTEEHNVFPSLENVTSSSAKTEFLASVQTPVKAVKQLAKDGFKVQEEEIGDFHHPKVGGIALILKLDDALETEDRPDFLRRHDRIIAEKYGELLSSGLPILAMYVGRHSSWVAPESTRTLHRVRRLLAENGDDPAPATMTRWMSDDGKVLLYSSSVPRLMQDSVETNLTTPLDIKSDIRPKEQRMIINFNGGTVLRLQFPATDSGYWSLSQVEIRTTTPDVEMVLSTASSIVAPYDFSYHCNEPIVFSNGTTTLTFSHLQVQPYLTGTPAIFSEAYDCVYFFTIPIWSGLFVTALLGSIMMWGILMILNIKTMDQFDDPKGKTITISATD